MGRGVLVKGPVALLVGSLTWFAAEEVQNRLADTEWIISAQLSLLMGGISFLAQHLAQFERRIESLEAAQSAGLAEIRRHFEKAARSRAEHQVAVKASLEGNFARISRATEILAHMEGSPFSEDELEGFVRHANRLGADAPRLLRDLVAQEIRRLSDTVQQIGTARVTQYDGEDREWLLALAASAGSSIEAVSLPVPDARESGFEGGFWTSDLGERYLDLQAEAIERRGVRVRRVFVSDPEWTRGTGKFGSVLRRHQAKAVDVRHLEWDAIPEGRRHDVADCIIFDGVLTYELGAAQFSPRENRLTPDGESPLRPPRMRTELRWDERAVSDRVAMFELLWSLAAPLDMVGELAGSEHVVDVSDETGARRDVRP